MNYYEFSFTYTSSVDTEIINDILASELGEIGFESFTGNEEGLIAYVPELACDKNRLKGVIESFPLPDVNIRYTDKLIPGKDWNEEWEKNYFKPIRIGKECIIRASFHEAEPGYTHTIIIDPKMAFGTGNHETTYLMIQEILKLDFRGKEVLDMGCGTAVLAILALKKGASRVTAIDIDEWAYNNAIENIRLNHSEKIEVALGGAEEIQQFAPFDIIFANINRNILLADMKFYAQAMKPGSTLLLSGFYKEDVPVIELSCKENNLSIQSVEEKNNWVVVKTTLNNIL